MFRLFSPEALTHSSRNLASRIAANGWYKPKVNITQSVFMHLMHKGDGRHVAMQTDTTHAGFVPHQTLKMGCEVAVQQQKFSHIAANVNLAPTQAATLPLPRMTVPIAANAKTKKPPKSTITTLHPGPRPIPAQSQSAAR